MTPAEWADIDRRIAAIIRQKAIDREVLRRIERRRRTRFGPLLGLAVMFLSAALVVGAIWWLW